MLIKLRLKREGGLANADMADKFGGRLGEMLILADKEGSWGLDPPPFFGCPNL